MMYRSIATCVAALCWGLIALDLHAQETTTAPQELRAPLTLPETDETLPGAGPLHRAEWFQNVWRNRRGEWAKNVEQDQGALVFLGDSITQGWGDDFGGRFANAKVVNRGIGGDTTRGVLYRLEDDVLSVNPAGVVMLIGTNDIGLGADADICIANMRSILAALAEHNSAMPVVFCLVMPSSESKDRPTGKIQELNKRYLELLEGNEQVTVFDTFSLFANEEGDADIEEFPDLLHLNPAAYDKWAAALRPVLAELDLLEAEATE